MSTWLEFADGWREPLAALGLDSFDALMARDEGKCVSWHTRGQTYSLTVAGETVYLKRDSFAAAKDILADLCMGRVPQPPCIVEVEAMRQLAALGIRAPQPAAWGQRRRLGLPRQAVLIMRQLRGVALSHWLKAPYSPAERLAALGAVARLAARLYAAGLSWPDVAPKHFFLPEDPASGSVGVLDLARMRPSRLPRRLYMPKQIGRFCHRLRACGVSEEEVKAFLIAMRPDPV